MSPGERGADEPGRSRGANIARKTDPSATLYKWYPPVRFDGGRDID